MSLHQFQQFLPVMQLLWVIKRGTSLANRWDDESSVNLYHCAGAGRGFFVEVGVDNGRGQAVVLRSFSDSEALAEYAHGVRLPKGMYSVLAEAGRVVLLEGLWNAALVS